MIGLELLLSVASAVLVGLLLWFAMASGDDRGVTGGPIVGVLVMVGLAVGAGWFLWLTGVSGWLLAGASGVAGIQIAFLSVLGASEAGSGVSGMALLLSLGCAVLGGLCGVFLPSPSSRRYRPAPRVRAQAGGPASAPRISARVANVTDRYAKPAAAGVVAGAAAVTAAGFRRASRATPTPSAPADVPPAPVLQPQPGTPIRTTGPTSPVPDAAAGGPATGRATTPVPADGGVVPALDSQGAVAHRGAGAAPRAATPAKGTPARKASVAPSAPQPGATAVKPRQDPGAIARSGRASIDAELAGPARPGPGRTPSSGSPGFRLVDPPPPMRRVRPASSDGPRLSPVDRPPPPRPPRGRPVGRAGDIQQVADPGAVAPTVRSLPPGEPPPGSADRPASPSATPAPRQPTVGPTDETLPYPNRDMTGDAR